MDKDLIHDYTINNKCSMCGQCCSSYIPLTSKEIITIRNYVKKHNIKPEQRIIGNNIIAKCCFLDDKTNRCKIYEVRPYVCKDFLCSHKDWKERRENYGQISKYNGNEPNNKLLSFQDCIYNDTTFTLHYIFAQCIENDLLDEGSIVRILIFAKRLDLLQHFIAIDTSNKKVTGKQLFKKGIKQLVGEDITYDQFIKNHPELTYRYNDDKE